MTFYTMDKNEPNTIVAKSLEKLLKWENFILLYKWKYPSKHKMRYKSRLIKAKQKENMMKNVLWVMTSNAIMRR